MDHGFYRGIVEGVSCGVLTIDLGGHVLTINSPARSILEIDDRAVEGQLCDEVLHHHPRLVEILLESLSCSTLPSRAEVELKTRDERGRTIGFSISRIVECEEEGPKGNGAAIAERRSIGAAIFFKDLTQVEQQEEQDRLRDRLAALGQMAAQMAHEIRNPMAAIAVTAQLLRRRLAASGESTEPVERISREIGRVERTIASCLEYVRPLSPSFNPQSLRVLLAESVEEARRRGMSGDVIVDLSCGEGLEMFPCDGPRLREVFCNLMVNAMEAMEGSGRITIRASAIPGMPDGFAIVRIGDTGPGVPPELRDRIFYPFFTTKTTGSGIGLAMARKIVEAHRGVIDVSGQPNEGATFTIKLPFQSH